jgi:hypothetical protein
MSKIALCIYGQIRSFELVKESLKNNLIDIYDMDIFIHFWNRYDNSIKVNEGQFNHVNGDIEYGNFNETSIDEILNFLKPKLFKIEEPIEYAKNTESMFYSMEQVNNLKKEYESRYNFEYDIVLRTRIDLYHNSKINLLENDLINIINRPGGCGGFNDWLAFGNSKNMNLISSIYSEYKENDRIKEPCPEGLLNNVIKDKNININYIPKTFDIFRKNGIRV